MFATYTKHINTHTYTVSIIVVVEKLCQRERKFSWLADCSGGYIRRVGCGYSYKQHGNKNGMRYLVDVFIRVRTRTRQTTKTTITSTANTDVHNEAGVVCSDGLFQPFSSSMLIWFECIHPSFTTPFLSYPIDAHLRSTCEWMLIAFGAPLRLPPVTRTYKRRWRRKRPRRRWGYQGDVDNDEKPLRDLVYGRRSCQAL